MQERDLSEDFSVKRLFIPFTTLKAIHWTIFIGFLVYSNSLFNGFVIDDIGQIVASPIVHTLTSIPTILFNQTSMQLSSNYYRPLPSIFYTFLYICFQDMTFPYHLLQLVFHMGNAILVFLIFKRYMNLKLSWFLSLLFLIHPINEETVAYIANLQDVLFVFFGLLAFYLCQLRIKKQHYIILASAMLLFLSILSKETGFLFVAIILLYIYLFKRKQLSLYLYYTAGVSIIYCILRQVSQVPIAKDPLIPIMRMPLVERMLSVPEIIFYYVQTLLFPKDLVALHSWAVTSVQLSNFFLPLLIDIVAFGTILTAFWFTYRKKSREKIALLFLGWFVIGLCVHLQIFPIDMTVADHYFYFPFIGLLGLLGLVLQQLPFKRQHLILVVTIEVILLAACSARTMVRNTDWINQTTLSAHDEKVAENDYLIEMLYGLDLLEQDNYTAAYPHIMRAVTLYPQSWKAWLALGAIYYQRGNLKKAEDAYRHSIAIRKSSMAYEDLALILLREPADLRTTMAFLREATHVYPNSQKLWYYRMIAERKSGDYDNELQAAQNYHFLRGDKESESIYMRILQNQPIKFDL